MLHQSIRMVRMERAGPCAAWGGTLALLLIQPRTEPPNLEAPVLHQLSPALLSLASLVTKASGLSTAGPEPSRLGWGAPAHSPESLCLQDTSGGSCWAPDSSAEEGLSHTSDT